MINERFNDQAIREHNRLRSLHGCPELQLDEDLMISAQKWAENLAAAEKLYHSNYNDYGENLAFKMSASPCQITGEEVSQTWYSEIDYHDFTQSYHPNSRHFTQMIWKSTTRAGFGLAFSQDQTKAYVVGRYLPVGNKGDFGWNVPHYQGIKRSESMYSLDRNSIRSSHRRSFRESLGLSERCKCYWDHTPYAPEGHSLINEDERSRTGSIRSGDFQRSRPTSFSNNDDIHYKSVYTKSSEDLRPKTINVTTTSLPNTDDAHNSLCSPTVINLNFMNSDERPTIVTNTKPSDDFSGSSRMSIRTSVRRPTRSSTPVCNGHSYERESSISSRGSSVSGKGIQYCSYCKQRGHNTLSYKLVLM
ncbi:venom allergen-like (VAL) 6 protein [Schistosoma mansoni]|uniref:venom allergen-like (VAL) 6 protein n=1 Tax=Schistosoma mansoni TaxID=6183 RepID=UPI0001A64286|nr:venom allergen-like (VAL) 6 protein [Schistosoma mansoni]|eukprot:XP_018647669.1 venom allergen-like (VAL) 6 protein [Schistosoma mansoni]